MSDTYGASPPGNFINPAYATPEQVKQLREYAAQLMAPQAAGNIAPSWAGALAGALNPLAGQMRMNQANRLQQGAIQNAAQQDPAMQMLQARGLLGQGAPTSAPGQSAQSPYAGAVSSIESGGNYQSLGPQTKSGDRAFGKYQVMGQNIGPWTKETLGQELTPQQFLQSPQAQEAVFNKKFTQYAQAYGPEGAARAWFAGPSNMNNPTAKDELGTTVADYSRRFQQAQGPAQSPGFNPAQYNAYQHNPYANPQEQALARGLVTPTQGTDLIGRPTVGNIQSGVRSQPVGQGVTTGTMVPLSVSPEGGVSTQVPMTGLGQYGGGPQSANPQGAGTPTAGMAGAVAPFAQMGRDLATQNKFTEAWRGPQVSAVTQDQNFLGQYPVIKQALGVIGNDLEKHGANLSMGPQSETIQNMKKLVANFAPGLFSNEQIEGIAAGDSVTKMSGILGTLLARQIGNSGGTDFSQQLGQAQVPGMHNSLEGAKALKSMIEQMTEQQYQLGLAAQKLNPGQKMGTDPSFNYIAWKNDWYANHPIINPITKNPITQDLSKYSQTVNEMQQGGGGWKTKSDAEVKDALRRAGMNIGP